MLKNPFLNAFMAFGYIAGLVLAINQTSAIAANTPDTMLAPITMLSLLVLSVSVMGLLFFYEPLRLFFENQKQEALSFFLKAVTTFGGFVVVLVSLLFYTSVMQ